MGLISSIKKWLKRNKDDSLIYEPPVILMPKTEKDKEIYTNVFGNKGYKIAVSEPGHDDVKKLLENNLKFDCTEINNSDLYNYDLIKQYKVIFINCHNDFYPETNSIDEDKRDILHKYVEKGGHLYVSDWACIFIRDCFNKPCNFNEVAHAEESHKAEICSKHFKKVLGNIECVYLTFDQPKWYNVENGTFSNSIKDNLEIILKSATVFTRCKYINRQYDLKNIRVPEETQTIDGSNEYPPLAFLLRYGEGSIFFTSYHFSQNITKVALKILEKLISNIFTGPIIFLIDEAQENPNLPVEIYKLLEELKRKILKLQESTPNKDTDYDIYYNIRLIMAEIMFKIDLNAEYYKNVNDTKKKIERLLLPILIERVPGL